jgi:hypothetical protein
MLVLSSTIASRDYNYCTDGNTSPGIYGYLPVDFMLLNKKRCLENTIFFIDIKFYCG